MTANVTQTIADEVRRSTEVQAVIDGSKTELEIQAERGQKYGYALNTLREFIEAEQLATIQKLEFHDYASKDELDDLLAKLRTLREFVSTARTYYALGKQAEAELNGVEYNNG